jgi:hypothetical protein
MIVVVFYDYSDVDDCSATVVLMIEVDVITVALVVVIVAT